MSNETIKLVLTLLLFVFLLLGFLILAVFFRRNHVISNRIKQLFVSSRDLLRQREEEYYIQIEEELSAPERKEMNFLNKKLYLLERALWITKSKKTTLMAILLIKWAVIVVISIFVGVYYKFLFASVFCAVCLYIITERVIAYMAYNTSLKFEEQTGILINNCTTISSYGVAFTSLLEEASVSVPDPLKGIVQKYLAGSKSDEERAFVWLINKVDTPVFSIAMTSLKSCAKNNADYSDTLLKLNEIFKTHINTTQEKKSKVASARTEIAIMSGFVFVISVAAIFLSSELFAKDVLYFALVLGTIVTGIIGCTQRG